MRWQWAWEHLPAAAALAWERHAPLARVHAVLDERLATILGPGRLLDLGCGTGELARLLAGRHPGLFVTGVDVSAAMVALARRRTGVLERVDFLVADAGRLPAEWTGRYDWAVATGSLYLWRDPLRALAQLHRVLRPGGRAWLAENRRDCDRPAVWRALARADVPAAGRVLTRLTLPMQLAASYSTGELERLFAASAFAGHARVTPDDSAGALPVRVWIELERP